MELEELIKAIKETSPEDFKEALHKGAQSHYQQIFNAGHSTATGAAKAKETDLAAKIEELEGIISEKDTQLSEISSKKPDLEKIKAEYEQALVKKDEEWRGKVEKLESSVIGGKRESLRQELINSLQGEHHVDAWAAQKAVDDSVIKRFDIKLDGTYKVYQQDGQTPYMPADGQSHISLLASELVESIPKSLIKPPKNNDSGYKGGGNGTPSTTKKRSEFSREERISFINEHGLQAYEALPMT